ncbi:hypothetical protein M0R45_026655 [Rubus argutus]|uniref:Uncharacterized protein n=1 Tax=Rubus argutus TaxID=59490 RepID=A0AAW1X0N4_RUBAR
MGYAATICAILFVPPTEIFLRGDAPKGSSTPKVEVETTSSSSSSLGGDSSDADLSPSTCNIHMESMFPNVGFTSGEDLVPLASISREGSSATVYIEANQPVVSVGPDFEFFKQQATQNMDGISDVCVEIP